MKTERICCKIAPILQERPSSRKNRSGTRCKPESTEKNEESLGRNKCISKHERVLLLISLRLTCYRYCINCVYTHILFIYASYTLS